MKDERLEWAEAKLTECQRIALRYFGTTLRIERKADRSPVTIADRTIEERLRRELGRAFPRDAIVGEEFGASTTAPSSYWTIDPIDGTRAFSRGLPSWGMLLGWVEQGRPALGACLYPMFHTFLGVGRRTPAFERTAGRVTRLRRAPNPPALSDAVIFHGGSRWWFRTPYAAGFRQVVRACYLERAYGDCFGYLWLFRGHTDAVLDVSVKVWDMVPLAALAAATDRVLVDFSGRPCFTGPQAIMAHPRLARVIAQMIRSPASNRSVMPKWRVS